MFWQALHDAYFEDFLKLKNSEEAPLLHSLRELIRKQLMTAHACKERPPKFSFLSPRFLTAGAIVYLAASLWICSQIPWLGIPLLLAPLLLLFLC